MKATKKQINQLRKGYNAGDYGQAYVSGDLGRALERNRGRDDEAFVIGFTLGFFATFEIREIPDSYKFTFVDAYTSDLGAVCRDLGIAEDRDPQEFCDQN